MVDRKIRITTISAPGQQFFQNGDQTLNIKKKGTEKRLKILIRDPQKVKQK